MGDTTTSLGGLTVGFVELKIDSLLPLLDVDLAATLCHTTTIAASFLVLPISLILSLLALGLVLARGSYPLKKDWRGQIPLREGAPWKGSDTGAGSGADGRRSVARR